MRNQMLFDGVGLIKMYNIGKPIAVKNYAMFCAMSN